MGQFAPVWLYQIGTAISYVIATLRVDDDTGIGLARRPDDLERHPFGQHALGVIRDDDNRMVGHKLARQPQQVFADIRIERDRAFAVGTQELLIACDIARLYRGRPLRLDEDMRLGAVLRFYQTPDLSAGFVVADNGNERCSRAQRPQKLDESLLVAPEPEDAEVDDEDGEFDPDEDPLLEKAIEIVVQTQTASVSLIQRRLRVGYTRAGRLIDMLERRGIISGYEGSKPRRVLVGEGDLDRVPTLDR